MGTRLGLAGAAAELLNAGTDLANRVLGAPALAANLSGWVRPKRLRTCAVILGTRHGAGVRPLAAEAAVREALHEAAAIFRRRANVELVFGEWPKVVTAAEPAPDAALDVACGRGSWLEDLGEAGAYFRRMHALAGGGGASVTGYAEPITVFVVRDVAGKAGCSMGPLSDYVTVDRVRGPLIAHELGHACGLWHTGEPGNLMLPAATSEEMTRLQRAIFRNSRHVTAR